MRSAMRVASRYGRERAEERKVAMPAPMASEQPKEHFPGLRTTWQSAASIGSDYRDGNMLGQPDGGHRPRINALPQFGTSGTSILRRVSLKPSVIAPHRDGRPSQPQQPVGERAAKAAAFVFRACDSTRTGTLLRHEFATAVEMMMRQKLVQYLIDQVDASRLDAEFAEASQGGDEWCASLCTIVCEPSTNPFQFFELRMKSPPKPSNT